jgi:NAD(P)-dependent dehydrogenase (short-subunit alcohol dehydrogenase family)
MNRQLLIVVHIAADNSIGHSAGAGQGGDPVAVSFIPRPGSRHEAGSGLEVNLISVLDICRLTAPLLLAAPAASVINVASMYGIVASRSPMAAYNATKGALVSLTRQLAAQWGERGVRVNALAPGYFPTELTGYLADAGFAQSIREHTLLARTPALEEIDGPLLFLATAASSYMTGQILVIDGGWTAV